MPTAKLKKSRIPEIFSPKVREAWQVPRELSVSSWADECIVLDHKHAEPGKWRTSRTPYAREIMDSFTDPLVEHIVLMTATQVVKTSSWLNMLGYAADQDPGPALVVMPREEDGKKICYKRIIPMFRKSPRLARAKFLQAFVKVGLIPDSGACWLLPRLCGLGRAMELAFTGEAIDAKKALDYGLVNRVLPAAEALAAAQELADGFAKGPTRAFGLMKRAFNRAMTSDIDAFLAYEAQTQEIAGRSDDYREGVAAFVEKRPAQFIGK